MTSRTLDVAGAFDSSISSYLMIPTSQIFDCVDSPQDWKPFDRTRTHLARSFSNRCGLLAKHVSIITQVQFSEPPTNGVSFTPASPDKYHQGVVDKSRTF